MAYNIRYLPVAEQDLYDVAEYLSQFYADTFKRFMATLEKSICSLADTPLMYEEYHDDPFYRRMVVGDYLVFYHVDEAKHIVEIHRVLHGSRDVRQYID